MRKLLAVVLLVLLLCSGAFAAEREKVILDTDMVELFDDGIAMIMLANAPNVDLLGVVTVAGNVWAQEGVAYGVRQLELIGKTKIPVYQGMRHPLAASRMDNMELERQMFGIGPSKYTGAFSHAEPRSWELVYQKKYGAQSKTKIGKAHGVDFIIEQVKKYPGQVSIAAIGPCTNIAVAIRKAPEIVPLIKQIVYMGGAFEVQGNTTPAAEFNWWFDPDAAKMTVRAPFKSQTVVGLDVCEKVLFTKEHYNRLIALPKLYPGLAKMFEAFYVPRYAKNPEATSFVWDLIAAAIIVDPTVVTEAKDEWIDVDNSYSVNYGRSLGYKIQGPAGTRKAKIVFSIDENKFWDMVYRFIQKK